MELRTGRRSPGGVSRVSTQGTGGVDSGRVRDWLLSGGIELVNKYIKDFGSQISRRWRIELQLHGRKKLE